MLAPLLGVLDAADGVGVTLVKPLLEYSIGSIRQIHSNGSGMREISTGLGSMEIS